jgi:hypothetical protein
MRLIGAPLPATQNHTLSPNGLLNNILGRDLVKIIDSQLEV